MLGVGERRLWPVTGEIEPITDLEVVEYLDRSRRSVDRRAAYCEMEGTRMKTGPWLVYVSGPYTHGDVGLNVRAAVLAGLQICQAGHLSFVPHLYHFAHYLVPMGYEAWMTIDLAMVRRCDAILRLPGDSPGADREVELARTLGMPVYFGVEACVADLEQGVSHG